MNRFLLLVLCAGFSLADCAGSHGAHGAPIPIVTAPPLRVLAPPHVALPPPATLERMQWREVAELGWMHLRSEGASPINVFEHGHRAFLEERVPLSYVPGRVAPYLVPLAHLLLSRDMRSIEDSAFAATPPQGVFVTDPWSVKRFDVTFVEGGRTRLLGDYAGPHIVDFFESDCSACVNEARELGALNAIVKAYHGVMLVLTSRQLNEVRWLLHRTDPSLIVARDNAHSVYAAFDVHRLPWIILQDRSGRIVDDYIGELKQGDVARIGRLIHGMPSRRGSATVLDR